ncbi:hypothetical protein Cni_G26757 [Canna indica]|uniref:DUF4408 domain-containing protein n=1 Tax=Canna indica TaxID=4628 RepID=A0AAQ3L0E6_9LILI|nr:hypothetical protein Cni_G26757 [Canna indica]
MKRYRRRRRQVLASLIQYSVAASLVIILLLTTPIWFPSLFSSLKLLLFVSLPDMAAAAFGPRSLFVVGNLIVVFLVGESKLLRSSLSSSSSSAPAIYEEYLKNLCLEDEERRDGGGWDEEEEEEEKEENTSLVELHKRSEDLIARVTQQWKLEARMLLANYHRRLKEKNM